MLKHPYVQPLERGRKCLYFLDNSFVEAVLGIKPRAFTLGYLPNIFYIFNFKTESCQVIDTQARLKQVILLSHPLKSAETTDLCHHTCLLYHNSQPPPLHSSTLTEELFL